MRTLFASDDYQRLMPWFRAVCAYDWADPAPLAELILAESVPPEFRIAIADIVKGERKPNLKAATKSKIPAAERASIAEAVGCVIDLCETIKFGTLEGNEAMADRLGMEPIDIIRKLEDVARKAKENAADQLSVSVETIENLLRDVTARMDRWPVV